jgi:glycosyltransferase involved in cell wall biosynthesis
MKIAIFTNTYTPHVGGVAKSVSSLVAGMRARGHDCLVIAPEFEDQPADEQSVVRIPSIQNFNGTDFSFKLPSGNRIGEAIKAFKPEVIHSHHPFLLGDAAMRMAHQWGVPLVFTHHTLYENYVHYVLEDSKYLKRLAIVLATEYANLCDRVIAPSGSIKNLITQRGVKTPVEAIPTGIDHERFRSGDGAKVRKKLGIGEKEFVLGHVGRLANEKNLGFLTKAALKYLEREDDALFLVVGEGECLEDIKKSARERGLADRLRFLGKLTSDDLVNAYHAMDLFVFSSKSETQGMVLAEAMAAGKPVIALDASGARDIIEDGVNGRLLSENSDPAAFARGIAELRKDAESRRGEVSAALEKTAARFSATACLDRVEALYRELVAEDTAAPDLKAWERFSNRIEAEWDIAVGKARAIGAAFSESE